MTPPRAEVPTATYRLQLRQGIDLARATALVPYLAELGIGSLYLSPIFAAYPGSTHGYDVIDPNRIDPEIGGREGFDRLVAALQARGMGLLLDIVPNHMRAHADNRWWRDVLEHGLASRFAEYFDLRWSADLEHRLVLPVLGDHYCFVLDRRELVPGRDAAGFVVRYQEFVAPLDPRTWPAILDPAALRVGDPRVLADLADACRELPPRTFDACEARARAVPRIESRLRAALRHPELAEAIDRTLVELRGRRDDAQSSAPLHALLDDQAWRLTYWRSGLGELNYRRFFDIAELVALRSDRPRVFAATHALVGELLGCDIPIGLRVDHIDGLADPRGYLRLLRELGVPWLIVEKILGDDEVLPGDWACDGTSGYEVGAAITRALVDADGAARLHEAWRQRNGGIDLEQAARDAKVQVLDASFDHTLRRLAVDLRQLTLWDRRARDVSVTELERALRELTASLPVYRTYFEPHESGGIDREILSRAVARAANRLVAEDRLALDFIERVLRGEPAWTDERAVEVASFVRRWQQLTGPIAAKGIEDTLMYRWTALAALAEVGAPVNVPVAPVDELHQTLWRRRRTQRAPLVSTATHDTKRGEDTRARIGVLSQLADEWLACSDEVAAALAGIGDAVADRDEIELILQAFVGVWPNEDPQAQDVAERLRAYATKSLREAKRHTDWTRPALDHEAAARERIDALLAGLGTTAWGRALADLQRRVAFHGAHDSLAQLVLKLASPGVCDVYQGTELWDLSLVDPDNRRPPDFEIRARILAELDAGHRKDSRALIAELRAAWQGGRIKAFVLWRGLQLRREHARVMNDGEVRPIEIRGPHAACACALVRRTDHFDPWVLAAVARTTTVLVQPPEWPIGAACWRGETLLLPEDAPTRWHDGWTGAAIEAKAGTLELARVFAELPVALLVGVPDRAS